MCATILDNVLTSRSGGQCSFTCGSPFPVMRFPGFMVKDLMFLHHPCPVSTGRHLSASRWPELLYPREQVKYGLALPLRMSGLWVQDNMGFEEKLITSRLNSHLLDWTLWDSKRPGRIRSLWKQAHRQPFLRYCGGHDHGHHGVELWLSTTQPIGYLDGNPVLLSPQNVVILHKDPRRILARIETTLEPFFVAVLHGPQSGIAEEVRKEWWEETVRLCAECETSKLVLLCDANAASGPRDDLVVFEHDDDTTPNTPHFIDALLRLKLCLPSTGQTHQGPHCTWVSPDERTSRRIDYVCIPQDIVHGVSLSVVLSEIDLGNGECDHSAVGLQLAWPCTTATTTTCRARPRIDDSRIRTLPNNVVRQYLQNDSHWTSDIETQVDHFNKKAIDLLTDHCAPGVQEAKKPFFTPELWQMRKCKLGSRRTLKRLHNAVRKELLASAFIEWKSLWRHSTEHDQDAAWNYRSSLLCYTWKYHAELYYHNLCLRRGITAGKDDYVRRHVDQLRPNASASDILHDLRPIMGSSNQRKRHGLSLPSVLDRDGNVCKTAEALTDRWVEHFGDMEGGERIDESTQRALWIKGLQEVCPKDLDLDLSEVPTLFDLECAYRHVRTGKATGHDGVPGALCHYFPAALASATFPHLLHLYLHGQEALTHKGGKLVTALKKGNRDLCSSYRSLLISSHVGKSLHRTLRQTQNHLYAAYMQGQQLGGRQKTPVGFAIHMCRAFQRYHRNLGHSCGFLFLDLTEAYYRVLRPLALGGNWNDEVIIKMAARLNLGPDAIRDLHEHLAAPHALDRAMVPAHHQRYLRALHQDTYFYLGQQTDVCRTEIGSRPGDSFADVVFGFLWARLLRSLEQEIAPLGVAANVPKLARRGLQGELATETQSFLGPTWCDDLCIVFEASTTKALVAKISMTASCLFDACEGLAMTPNLKPGKTEALLCLQGKGSREARKQYFSVDNGGWMDVICNYKSVRLHVTGEYQHLGGILHHQGDQRKEARRRLALGHATFTTHRKLLLRNPVFTLERRLQLFQSLILSQITFGMESWTMRTRATQEGLHNSILRLYRRLLCHGPDAHVSDDDILSELRALSPTVLLRTVRLRYLGLVYRNGGDDLWALILQDEEWKDLIWADIGWMYRQLWNCSKLPDPTINFEAWEFTITNSPGYWKRLVRRAGLHDAHQRAARHAVLCGHKRICGYLGQEGRLKRPTITQRLERHESGAYGCMKCRKACRTKAGEGAHMFKVHQEINPVRALFDTTTCSHCLRCFHTPVRLGSHLKNNPVCRQHLVGRGHFYTPVPGAGSRKHEEVVRRHDGLLPPQQCEGPQRPSDQRDDFLAHSVSLHVSLLEYIAEDRATTTDEALIGLKNVISDTAISWTTCRTTLRNLAGELREEDFEGMQITGREVQDALLRLQEEEHWPFLQNFIEARTTEDLNYYELLLQEDSPWTRTRPIHQQIGADRFILHAFSGRRRPGDFEYYLRQVAVPNGIRIHVVSLDIVIDGVLGDLMNVETRTFWLTAIKRKWVLGFLGGPPCETWSQARGKEICGRRNVPRVVREELNIWGKLSLGLRELQQVHFGNTLLLFCLEALTLLLIFGGFGLMEHPARPKDRKLVSVWRLPIVTFLRSCAEVRMVDVDQGLFGARSRKPTTFLTLRLPDLVQDLRRAQLRSQAPATTSIGVGESGQFLTAGLKEYPPALCKALGDSFGRAATYYPPHDSVDESDFQAFAVTCQRLESRDFGMYMGKDFHGW